ncbi:MAG: hypothetical protein KI791_11260, partial [Cyclobacteriaceae bacterium]|nr:hypothetical protein [Cyclobacteriaceae bacterium SS2]
MKKTILFCFIVLGIYVVSSCNKEVDIQSGDPEIPRIDFVEMAENQPHQNNPSVIWYDDFSTEKDYLESRGDIDNEIFFGTSGGS